MPAAINLGPSTTQGRLTTWGEIIAGSADGNSCMAIAIGWSNITNAVRWVVSGSHDFSYSGNSPYETRAIFRGIKCNTPYAYTIKGYNGDGDLISTQLTARLISPDANTVPDTPEDFLMKAKGLRGFRFSISLSCRANRMRVIERDADEVILEEYDIPIGGDDDGDGPTEGTIYPMNADADSVTLSGCNSAGCGAPSEPIPVDRDEGMLGGGPYAPGSPTDNPADTGGPDNDNKNPHKPPLIPILCTGSYCDDYDPPDAPTWPPDDKVNWPPAPDGDNPIPNWPNNPSLPPGGPDDDTRLDEDGSMVLPPGEYLLFTGPYNGPPGIGGSPVLGASDGDTNGTTDGITDATLDIADSHVGFSGETDGYRACYNIGYGVVAGNTAAGGTGGLGDGDENGYQYMAAYAPAYAAAYAAAYTATYAGEPEAAAAADWATAFALRRSCTNGMLDGYYNRNSNAYESVYSYIQVKKVDSDSKIVGTTKDSGGGDVKASTKFIY